MAATGWSSKRRKPAPKAPVRRVGAARPSTSRIAPPPKPVVGAAAAPAQVPQRVASGFVPDSIYNNTVDYASRVATADRGQVDEEERRTKHEFGIDDPTNPFSRTALMKRMYLARGRAATNSMASRGQLYAGSHQRAAAQVRHGEERDTAALRAEYEGALASFAGRRTQIGREEEEARIRAQEEWMARQEPADYDSATPAAAAAPAAAKAPKPAAPKTRKRGGKTEYQWPNGTWHSRPHRGN